MIPKFAYVKAGSLNEALKELTSEGARIHAGGSDLMGCLRDGVFGARKVVSLTALTNLAGMKKTAEGGLRIGTMTNVVDIAEDDYIAENYTVLHDAVKAIASPQLRNQGTLGGNICQRPRCWYYRGDFHCAKKGGDKCYAENGENIYHCIFGGDPCYIVHPSDSAPALVALRAKIKIAGSAGERTVPMEQFFVLPEDDLFNENILKPNEVVTEVILPPPAAGMKSAYKKVRTRGSWDFALVSAAVAVQLSGGKVSQVRIVMGGVAPKPWRAPEAEQKLVGKVLNAESAAFAAEEAVKGARPLAQNGYKIDMARGAVQEVLMSLA